MVVSIMAFDQGEKLQETYVIAKNNNDKAAVMRTLLSYCSCSEFVQNLGWEAFQALSWAFGLLSLLSTMAETLPSYFWTQTAIKEIHLMGTALIVDHIWKFNKPFGPGTWRDVHVSSWVLWLGPIGFTAFPYKSCAVRIVHALITSGMLLEMHYRFIVAWKPPKRVCLALRWCQYLLSLSETQEDYIDMVRTRHLWFM